MLKDRKIIFESQQISRNYPENIKNDDIKFYEPTINGVAKETVISNFINITINNELFMKEGYMLKILAESFGDTWQDKVYNKKTYLLKNYIKNLFRKKKQINCAIWCLDQFSTGGYYHWLTEICPRLWIANQYVAPEIPLLVPRYFFDKWNFSKSFFEPFNREIITFQENEVIKVNNLTFIGQTGGVFNFQPLSIHASSNFLKNYFLKDIDGSFEKIYISRNKSGKRTIINENEILPILAEFGFKVIYTEDMPIQKQIELFSKTTHLLSIHGAGLTNLVFMPPKSNVIEIRHEEINQMLNCFHTLAHTFEMNYYYVFGESIANSLPNENRPEDKSIQVDIEMLKQVLQNT